MDKFKYTQQLADQRGLFFPTAEIHSSLSGFWDFGPFAANVRRKLIDTWRKEVVRKINSIEIEGSVILPKQNFKASGHLDHFVDPLVQCRKCHKIFRADKLLEKALKKEVPEALDEKKFDELVKSNNVRCPECKGELGNVKKFNMMLGVSIGPLTNETNAYLRPETCQNIFTAFYKIYKTGRVSLPLAISQVGRAFRNEISPRQGLLRMREFTQLETEVFFNPRKIDDVPEFDKYKNYKLMLKIGRGDARAIKLADIVKRGMVSGKLVAYYLAVAQQFFQALGFQPNEFRFRKLEKEAKAFYSKETWDFEVKTEVGWLELVANNYRTDYDLTSHSKVSGIDLSVVEDGEKFIPHVWEISMGLDRIFYALVEHSVSQRDGKPILKLPKFTSPLDAVVLPLVRKDGIDEKAKMIYDMLKKDFDVKYDEKQSIGKRYLIYDQLGVPLAITVDYESLKNDDVTVRDRDTSKQVRVKIADLNKILNKMCRGEKIF
ncbi:MAG: glycine--tRNA ligase [Candidatus Aenigmarchaeota archaeon]|nr:glycine--tRNA ligase [Candidatus Aenigmarchaeota archaeon]